MRCTDMMPYLQLVSSTQSLPPPDLIQAYTGWPGDSCWGVDSVDSLDSVDSVNSVDNVDSVDSVDTVDIWILT